VTFLYTAILIVNDDYEKTRSWSERPDLTKEELPLNYLTAAALTIHNMYIYGHRLASFIREKRPLVMESMRSRRYKIERVLLEARAQMERPEYKDQVVLGEQPPSFLSVDQIVLDTAMQIGRQDQVHSILRGSPNVEFTQADARARLRTIWRALKKEEDSVAWSRLKNMYWKTWKSINVSSDGVVTINARQQRQPCSEALAVFGSNRHLKSSTDDIEQDYDLVLVVGRKSGVLVNRIYKPGQDDVQILLEAATHLRTNATLAH
jgi:hypothetical protein